MQNKPNTLINNAWILQGHKNILDVKYIADIVHQASDSLYVSLIFTFTIYKCDAINF